MDAPLVGRDEELAQAWGRVKAGGSTVFTGPAGTGKSTVLAAVTARARAAGWRVLRSAPTQSEVELPFLALIDLLSGVDPTAIDQLDTPWKAALTAVSTGGASHGDPAQQLAIRLAMLHLLRHMASDGRTLLAVDDLQWIDRASAEVLAFVARRCPEWAVSMVAAERICDDPAPQRLAMCPPPVSVCELAPLGPRAIHDLLRAHTGTEFAHTSVQRIHATSGGNPLFALEIGRALGRCGRPPDPEEPLPVPDRLRELMRARLAGLSRSARQTLLLASIAARPTGSLLQRAGRRTAAADLAAAERLGILASEGGGTVRFSHPLLGATLYAEATARQRRYAHARLAEAAGDPIERARHRAKAATGPDSAIADELAMAADAARQRGAPAIAAELGMAAAARTPADSLAAERRLAAARDSLAAGHCEQARAAAEAVLTESTSRPQRVRAWLAVLDATSQALPHAESLVAQALADAGDDPGLQAEVRIRAAAKAWVEGRLEHARAQARRCGALAADAGRPATVLQAHCLQMAAELALGLPHRETLARLLDLAPAGESAPLYQGPRHLLARVHLNADRIDAARSELRPLLAQAEQAGRVEDMAGLLFNLAEVELRAGRCDAARHAAQRGLALVEDADLSAGPALATAALVEAAGGDPALAMALARRGVQVSEADGDRMFLLRNLHALGAAALVAGHDAAAAAALSRVASIDASMGGLDPALFRWHADLAEALVLVHREQEAREVIDRARAAATRLHRRSVLASLARAEAWHQLSQRAPAPAAARLRATAGQLRHLPLEYGRSCYALGVAQRRQRRRAAARAAFQEALRIFEAAGAAPWAARVRQELTHTDPAPAAEAPLAGLTRIEHRIATLVTTGATNQQVATALSLSVKTVEGYLTRIYRKLQVRSRAELAGTLAASRGT